jgi:FkbM family methyltransferase
MMATEFLDHTQLQWIKDVGIVRRDWSGHYHHFDVPSMFEPHRHMFENWENERFASIRDHLKSGDVFYDVGSELGWQSIVYAASVGPSNMVLIEACPVEWPNIRTIWERNYPGQPPLACYEGFMSDVTTTPLRRSVNFEPWPADSVGRLVAHIAYKHMHDDADKTPELRLDDLCTGLGRPPRAINIDVEGAELTVLKGAEQTFKEHRPLMWVSIHPDLMEKWYGTTPDQIYDFMDECGYNRTYLGTDHEEHHFFEPR